MGAGLQIGGVVQIGGEGVVHALQGHRAVHVVGLHLAAEGVVALAAVGGAGHVQRVGAGVVVAEVLEVLALHGALRVVEEQATDNPRAPVVAVRGVRLGHRGEGAAEAVHQGVALEVGFVGERLAVLRLGVDDRPGARGGR